MNTKNILSLILLLAFLAALPACDQAIDVQDAGSSAEEQDDATVSEEVNAEPSPIPLDLNAGLIAYYPFDGDLLDASGHGHDGQSEAPVYVTDLNGAANSALSFNGVDTIVSIPDDDELDLLGDFTISMWLRGATEPTHQWLIIAKHLSGDCQPESSSWFLRYVTDPNGLHISYYDSSAECGTHPGYGTLVPLDDGNWHHIAVTFQRAGNVLTYYFDCEQVFTQNLPWAPQDNPQPLTLGNQVAGGESTSYAGDMDEVRIYDQALGEPYIQALCAGN
jgi:hypothetical protein